MSLFERFTKTDPGNPGEILFWKETMADTPTELRRRFLQGIATVSIGSGVRAEGQENLSQGPVDPPRVLRPTEADLGSLFPDFEALVGAENHSLSFLHPRFRDWNEYRQLASAKVHELLAYQPPRVDLRPEVIDRVQLADHVRERVVFSTAANVRVPAYVLLPRHRRTPAPGIVDLHSHGGMFLFGKEKVIDFGRNHPAMTAYHERNYEGRPTATALVRRGYVVVVIDAFFFGERRTLLDADLRAGWDRSRYSLDDVQRLNQQCRNKETTLAKSMTLAGVTWPGVVTWDDLRTVDYLVSRPEVDPERIGCLGISMGGYRAMFLSALDPRIKAGCVAGFMSTVRPMLRRHIDTHSWVHFLPHLHRYLDWPDLAALTAPRSLMVLQCRQDRLFPTQAMQTAVDKISAIFQKAGARDRFVGRFHDVPHIFSRTMQDEAFTWLDRELRHQP